MNRFSSRRSLCWAPLLVLLGCGASTSLSDNPPEDAGARDSRVTRDAAAFDGGLPDGIVAIDAAACGTCDDGLLCNGEEICTAEGCVSLGRACDDGDACTVDECSEARGCTHTTTSADLDGDGVTTCGGDCDDENPRVFPSAEELCDGIDNNCDGDVDEGVLSECGDCRPGCQVLDVPREAGGAWEASDTEFNGVDVGPDGSLRLTSTRMDRRFAWIANTGDATLTKLDLSTGAQVGEFDSTLQGPGNGARALGERCETEVGLGNCPSRTAVDQNSTVYVANRAFFGQGTLTKIAGLEEECIDRNGNGRIETSRDLNGNGRIERGGPEYLGQDDECLLWTVDVGGEGDLPRAVAIDARGFVWVGLHDGQRVLRLDPVDGRVLQQISLTRDNFQPYGAAVSGDGTLWLVEAATGRIIPITAETGAVGRVQNGESRIGCSGNYGVAIDQRDRVWLAGFQCDHVARYDPRANSWFHLSLPESGVTRGVAVDNRGFVYVASSHTFIGFGGGVILGDPISRLTRFRADDGGDVRIYGTPDNPLPGLAAVGVGLDDFGNVWLIGQDSGSAVRVDPDTGAAREFPVGDSPYTYSDFTGFAFRTITVPTGTARTQLEGCSLGPTEWEELRWRADLPAGATVRARVRAAASRELLSMAVWRGPFDATPAAIDALPSEAFLEVEFTLREGPSNATPILRDYAVQFNCPVVSP